MNRMIVLGMVLCVTFAASAEIHVVPKMENNALYLTIVDGETTVFTHKDPDTALTLVKATAEGSERFPVRLSESSDAESHQQSFNGHASDLNLSVSYQSLGPDLIEQKVSVTAKNDARFYLDFGWQVAVEGTFHSFTGEEKQSASYSPGCMGPEFGGGSLQTFPFLGCFTGEKVYGIIGDTPGL